jgi:hypothetical protein
VSRTPIRARSLHVIGISEESWVTFAGVYRTRSADVPEDHTT